MQFLCEPTGNSHLLEKEDKVEEEVNLALSAFILAVSLFFVSENWVAMTTRQRFIMKKEPTLGSNFYLAFSKYHRVKKMCPVFLLSGLVPFQAHPTSINFWGPANSSNHYCISMTSNHVPLILACRMTFRKTFRKTFMDSLMGALMGTSKGTSKGTDLIPWSLTKSELNGSEF